MRVARHNYPRTLQLGNVETVRARKLARGVDLLIGGSPCQGFSRAGLQLGLADPRSALFFEYLRLRDEAKPTYFLLENVRMSAADEETVTGYMGVEPILINSETVTAGRRPRLYWTNIPFDSANLRVAHRHPHEIIDWFDVSENTQSWHDWFERNAEVRLRKQHIAILNDVDKAITQTARQVANWNGNIVRVGTDRYRFASPEECEALQTVPKGYTAVAPKRERYKMLGNGWTVEVVAAIFRGLRQ